MIVGDLWSDTKRGKPRYLERTCPSATFSAIYSTETGLGSKLGLRGEMLPGLFCGIISLSLSIISLNFVWIHSIH